MHVTRTPKTAFVVSPIGTVGTTDHRRHKLTLDFIIRKALESDDWDVVRADDEASPDSITSQVIERIIESDVIIAVLTDHNPNVFYELAVAHGYKKPVVHLLQNGQDMPFDVGDQRAIMYELEDPESVDAAIRQLRESVAWVQDNVGKMRNPLSSYERFATIENSGSTDGGAAVADALREMSSRLARLEGRDARVGSESNTQRFFDRLRPETRRLLRSVSFQSRSDGDTDIVVSIEGKPKELPITVLNDLLETGKLFDGRMVFRSVTKAEGLLE